MERKNNVEWYKEKEIPAYEGDMIEVMVVILSCELWHGVWM